MKIESIAWWFCVVALLVFTAVMIAAFFQGNDWAGLSIIVAWVLFAAISRLKDKSVDSQAD
jgi:hypothetical protein